MWGRVPWEHGWTMGSHPRGWAWMHGRAGAGFHRHAAMMDGSGHDWWISGTASTLAVMAALLVVGATLIVRHRPATPSPG